MRSFWEEDGEKLHRSLRGCAESIAEAQLEVDEVWGTLERAEKLILNLYLHLAFTYTLP